MFRLRAPPTLIAVAAVGLSACLVLRPHQLSANVELVRAAAQREWLERGTCSAHELRLCENRHQELTASDGFGYWTTAYDPNGLLEYEVSGACMGVMRRIGTRPDCPPERSTVVRDLCLESLDGLESRGFELEFSCRGATRRVRILPGTTRLALVDGVMLRVEAPAALRQPFDLIFEGAPAGVVLSSCTQLDGCQALDAGEPLTSAQFTVSSPTRRTSCELWVSRSFLVRAGVDAGVASVPAFHNVGTK